MTQLRLVATCAFGLEAVVKRELIALGFPDPRVVTPGRIAFDGDWAAVCKANIWLRVADRVLIEVLRFDAPDSDALFETVKAFDWTQFIPPDASFPVIGRSRNSQLTSVPAIQRATKKAIVESLLQNSGESELPETGEDYKVEIAILNDEAAVSIDTTGRSLHRRGYRKLVADAPIKETLAAAMIQLSVWNPGRMLVDPFCGSGTIPIEAALIGRNIAPGLTRPFASTHWPEIGDDLWIETRENAHEQINHDVELEIIGTDRDPDVLSMARYHARRAGVADDIHFQEKNFDELRSKVEYGCVISNPPYGERLEQRRRLEGLYESIPAVLQRLPTWSHFIITNMPRFEAIVQKSATRRRKLYNGRIECTYFQFLGPRPPRPVDKGKVVPETNSSESVVASDNDKNAEATENTESLKQDASKSVEPKAETTKAETTKPAAVFGGLQDKDHEQAGLLAARLSKRAKHLRKWPTKKGITCFRLYERDIPELPFVIDRYNDCLHMTEYERPHTRDAGRHAGWLELMKKTAAQVMEIPVHRVFLKSRLKSKQLQYQKLDQQQKKMTVQEDGLNFLVNLSDYVDTGLFLDHRNTRKMVREIAKGKHVLNLFAYTGSFSVYAAAGGAETTTTVDWSKTYLEWAQENFAANKLSGSQYQFVAQEAMDFLRANTQMFDVIVVDPPTFSNRKGREEDWDVQVAHVEMLNLIGDRLIEGGQIFFSTNFRRFKLDEENLARFSIREISQQTVPEDFRNRKIHRCWSIRHK